MAYEWTGLTDEELAELENEDPRLAELVRQRNSVMKGLSDMDPMAVAEATIEGANRFLVQLQDPELTKEMAIEIAGSLSFAVTMLSTKLRMECDTDIIVVSEHDTLH